MVTPKNGQLRRLALTLALLGSAAAHAQATAKVVVVPFSGPGSAKARDQVVQAVCGPQAECVPQARVVIAGKTDWDAVRKEGAHLVVAARASGPASRRVLTVEAYDTRPRLVFRERVKLARNGLIPRSTLQKLSARVGQAANDKARAAAPEPDRDTAPPDLGDGGEGDAAAEAGDEATEDDGDEAPSDDEAPRTPRSPEDQPLLVAEAGLFIAHRTFEYRNLVTPNLRSYVTRPAMFGPRLHLEAYPLTQVTHGPITRLGLEFDLATSVLLRSIDENDQGYATRFLRYDIGLRMGFDPLEDQALTVWPLLGYRGGGFTTGNNDAGERLVGLPNVGYGAVYAGAEGAFGLEPLTLLFRAVYLHGLDAGEVGSDAFFPDSSVRSFELSAGAGYPIAPNLEARARLEYTRYGYGFTAAEDATFRADGATDQQVGLSATVRYTF